MTRDERYEINNEGKLVVGIPTTLSIDEKKDMIEKLFNQYGWNYELVSVINNYHYEIKLTNLNLDKEHIIHLFHGNIRKEDPERNREEKKIQLGGHDPREYKDNGLILGIYVFEGKTKIENAIIVGWPIEQEKNYPGNPSLRVNVRADIMKAKNEGFYVDKISGKNIVAFRPEFIFYYLENYKKLHYAVEENDNQQPEDQPETEANSIQYETGLKTNFERNRIIFGAPGTGKSNLLEKDCIKLLDGTNGTFERVTFHPDYAYSHFIGTYKPVTEKENTEIKYEFVPGPFMRVYVEAIRSGSQFKQEPHLLIIEEINRAKVAAVFGDVFQLLDRNENGVSEYEIQLSEDVKRYLVDELGGNKSDYSKIKIPDNMFIWATMNSADQGVFPMDTAFKRRWNFEYIGIDKNEDKIKGKITLGQGGKAYEVSWNKLRKAINNRLINEFHVNEDKLLGPFFLSKSVLQTKSDTDDSIVSEDKFKDVFKSKVLMYLYEDAARQHRHRLFAGCENITYSSVCDEFDKIGINIFGDDFIQLYTKQKG